MQLASLLGRTLHVALTSEPLPEEELRPREQAQLGRLTGTRHREEWRRGRQALRRLLGRLGLDTDTSTLSFPHPRLSLTHTAGLALAVGSPGPANGLGVDLELGRTPRPGSERFFLDEEEQAWLRAAEPPGRDRQLLRLWTVKEAVFKANPRNRGTRVGQYHLEDCAPSVGRAGFRQEPSRYDYASLPFRDGFVTVAVRRPPC